MPLGVEHAVTVTYSGPELVVQPYRRGVAVNLRIVNVVQKGDFRTYDIRYIVSRAGEYDIMGYLAARDGSALENLPSFRVQGLDSLSEAMDHRIREVEPMGIDIWHHYEPLKTGVIAFWILWLLLLIFWPRRHPATEEAPIVASRSFHEILRKFLDQVKASTISDEEKRQMETLLFSWWRDQAMYDGDMYQVIRQIDRDPELSDAYRTLETWLHNPAGHVSGEDLVQALTPYTVREAGDDGPQTAFGNL
ncbi:MAG: hypothetical protein ACYS9X_10840 [Planctomycetota bacterium]